MKQLTFLQKLMNWIKPSRVQAKSNKDSFYESDLIGNWSVNAPKTSKHVSLEISSEGTGKYHTQSLKSILPQETPGRLVLRDNFGYQLVVEKKANEQYVLFDELDDATYPIEKK